MKTKFSMRFIDFAKELAKIILAILVVQGIYWTTQDFVIFNDQFRETLPLLYYSSGPLMAAFILLIIVFVRKYSKTFLFNVLILLLGTYLLFSFGQLYGGYCTEYKNLSQLYFIFNAILLASILLLFFIRIVPGLPRRSIFVNAGSFVLLTLDYYYFYIGFSIFNF